MAYQYNDYITIEDTAARETQLRKHIQEVSVMITPDVAKGGSSKSSGRVMDYLASLKDELKALVRANRSRQGTGTGYANFNGSQE